MSEKNKNTSKVSNRIKPRLPKGFRDLGAHNPGANDLGAIKTVLEKVKSVYTLYGFDPLETPLFEYTDCLGKFLPDSDRPNQGVFSLKDDDEQWMSLRYDLTAPLARHAAQNYDVIAKPYRTYRAGYVFRNEKPGPGRFRQFLQCDADSVGTAHPAADAEMCMMLADVMDALGLRGDYVVRLNNRKILDGIMALSRVDIATDEERRLVVLRAIDKLDRLGEAGVRALLGDGRQDQSGAYTDGARLDADQIDLIMAYVKSCTKNNGATLDALAKLVADSELGQEGVEELRIMHALFEAANYREDRILIDPSVVRGLDYYTGAVFEAELTFDVPNEKGKPVVFGSIGGGGRYDGLVSRFRAEPMPATGFSLGISRLVSALQATGKIAETASDPLTVILVMDPEYLADYQSMVSTLRSAGLRAEIYLGTSGLRAQMKYADKRGARCVVIQGLDERAAGEVQIKDLAAGLKASAQIEDHATWKNARPAQVTVAQSDLVRTVREMMKAGR